MKGAASKPGYRSGLEGPRLHPEIVAQQEQRAKQDADATNSVPTSNKRPVGRPRLPENEHLYKRATMKMRVKMLRRTQMTGSGDSGAKKRRQGL